MSNWAQKISASLSRIVDTIASWFGAGDLIETISEAVRVTNGGEAPEAAYSKAIQAALDEYQGYLKRIKTMSASEMPAMSQLRQVTEQLSAVASVVPGVARDKLRAMKRTLTDQASRLQVEADRQYANHLDNVQHAQQSAAQLYDQRVAEAQELFNARSYDRPIVQERQAQDTTKDALRKNIEERIS